VPEKKSVTSLPNCKRGGERTMRKKKGGLVGLHDNRAKWFVKCYLIAHNQCERGGGGLAFFWGRKRARIEERGGRK